MLTTWRPILRRAAPFLFLTLLVLVVAACATPGTGSPGASGAPSVSATPIPPLEPAQPGSDPVAFISWLFTPIFQAMFIVLCAVYQFLENLGVPAAIGWAIVVLTLLVRVIVIPLYRKQLVSTKRTQMLQPELREIQKRYKGDTIKVRTAQQELMKERGVNPLAGCFPLLLQMPLLLIMYSVISTGLRRPSAPSRMATSSDCPSSRNLLMNVIMTTPPFLARRRSTSSGTLRGWSVTARALECEKITGASETSSA